MTISYFFDILKNMIKLFLHLATMGNDYQKIHDELVDLVISSGLLFKSTNLTISIVGDGYLSKKENPQINYIKTGRIDEFEFPTLQLIEDIVHNTEENIKIFYFNGLGVTNDSIYKQSWRAYLSHFNIEHHMECINALDGGYDTAGVDFRTNPVPHYSGNFWWANSNYLKRLPKIQTLNKQDSPRVLTLRHNAEMYIGMDTNINPRVLHQSNISQYERHLFTYDEINYKNKIEEDLIKEI